MRAQVRYWNRLAGHFVALSARDGQEEGTPLILRPDTEEE
jgi:hypothetical protein